MNPYIEKLNSYLAENPPNYGYHDVHTLLDMLYNFYTECNPETNSHIKSSFEKLEHFLERFSLQECDQVLDTLSDLCLQQECLAFHAGIKIGVRLAAELSSE